MTDEYDRIRIRDLQNEVSQLRQQNGGPKRPEYEPTDDIQRLGYLVEECGEVLVPLATQIGKVLAALGKTIRWGADSYNPELPPEQRETNAAWLLRESADLQAALDRAVPRLRTMVEENADSLGAGASRSRAALKHVDAAHPSADSVAESSGAEEHGTAPSDGTRTTGGLLCCVCTQSIDTTRESYQSRDMIIYWHTRCSDAAAAERLRWSEEMIAQARSGENASDTYTKHWCIATRGWADRIRLNDPGHRTWSILPTREASLLLLLRDARHAIKSMQVTTHFGRPKRRDLLARINAVLDETPGAPSGVLAALEHQIRRLRKNHCPTMRFDFSPESTAAAVRAEVDEVTAEIVGSERAREEAAGVIAVAVHLAIVHGANVEEVVAAETQRLQRRLDHLEAGGTWAEAKAMEKLATPASPPSPDIRHDEAAAQLSADALEGWGWDGPMLSNDDMSIALSLADANTLRLASYHGDPVAPEPSFDFPIAAIEELTGRRLMPAGDAEDLTRTREVLFAVLAGLQRANRRGEKLARSWQLCALDFARATLPYFFSTPSVWNDEKQSAVDAMFRYARPTGLSAENEGLPGHEVAARPDTSTQTSDTYVILDSRQSVGNCGSWWATDGKGYVCNMDDAGRFSHDVAMRKRETDIPVPLDLAMAYTVRHVRVDQLCRSYDLSPGRKTVEERMAGRAPAPKTTQAHVEPVAVVAVELVGVEWVDGHARVGNVELEMHEGDHGSVGVTVDAGHDHVQRIAHRDVAEAQRLAVALARAMSRGAS